MLDTTGDAGTSVQDAHLHDAGNHGKASGRAYGTGDGNAGVGPVSYEFDQRGILTSLPHFLHHTFLDLVPHSGATHIAKTGAGSLDWFDPSSWVDQHGMPAGVPGDGAQVVIPTGVSVSYGGISEANIATIRVDGTLSFATEVSSKLVADYIAIADGGTFEAGTDANPVPADVTIDIVFDSADPANSAINKNWDPLQLSRGLIAGSDAKVSINGAERDAHATIAGNHLAGATEIAFEGGVPSNWQVGDTIVLTGTSTDKKGSHADNSKFQDEVLTIGSIDGNTITFVNQATGGNALIYDHKAPDGFDFDIYAANLTRNVRFDSADGAGTPVGERGHLMFMGLNVDIDGAGFYNLGRTDKNKVVSDPLFNEDGFLIDGSDSNVRGRYAVHFHKGLKHDPDSGLTAEVTNSAVWGSPGWGFVNHSSRVAMTGNVGFDVVGSQFVTEFGDEQGIFKDNIAIKTTGRLNPFSKNQDEWGATLLAPGRSQRGRLQDFASEGVAYWIHTPYAAKLFEGNIATGAADAGVLIWGRGDGQPQPDIDVSTLPEELQWIAGGAEKMPSWQVPLHNFKDTTVYNAKEGHHYSGALRDDNGNGDGPDYFNPEHLVPSVIENSTIWGVETGIHTIYGAHLTVKDSVLVGDGDSSKTSHSLQRTNEAKGVGFKTNAPATHVILENVDISQFNIGAMLNGLGHNNAFNDGPGAGNMKILGGKFTSNNINLHGAGIRVQDDQGQTFLNGLLFNSKGHIVPVFSKYTEISSDTVFEVPEGDLAPIATFEAGSLGGLSMRFDAFGSYDPDFSIDWTENTWRNQTLKDFFNATDGFASIKNTIAGYVWDFDGDGVFEGFGQDAVHVYDQSGVYDVTLKLFDYNGNSSSLTKTVTVDGNASFVNAFKDGDFDVGTLIPKVTDQTWLVYRNDYQTPLTQGLTYNPDYEWLEEKSNFHGIWQQVYNGGAHYGTQSISFDLAHLGLGAETSKNQNFITVELWGADGEIITPTWASEPIAGHNLSTTVTKLYSKKIMLDPAERGWSQIVLSDVDLGGGYERLAVRLGASGAWGGGYENGEFVALDNFKLGTPDTPNKGNGILLDNDTLGTGQDTSITFTADDLLANDQSDGGALSITGITNVAGGSISLANGIYTFTPDDGFFGVARFEYDAVNTSGATARGTASVLVSTDNKAPVAVQDSGFKVKAGEGITLNVADLLANDYDPDGDPLSLVSVGRGWTGVVDTLNFDDQKVSLTIKDDVTPGSYWFDYKVADPDGFQSNARVYFDVLQGNRPPMAVADSGFTVKAGGMAMIAAASLLENDSDPDGDTLTITSVANAVNGTVSLTATGDVMFMPADGYQGPASFSYTISDPKGRTATAEANVDVLSATPAIDVQLGSVVTSSEIASHSTAQDVGGKHSVDNGALTLSGNTWKKVDIDYTIKKDTWLSFDAMIDGKGEIQGLGLGMKGLSEAKTSFKLDGSQGLWGIDDYDLSLGTSGQWVSYAINVGKYFQGEAEHISFINDHDVTDPQSSSSFRNIRLSDGTTSGPDFAISLDGVSSDYAVIAHSAAQDVEGGSYVSSGELTLLGNTWKKAEVDYTITEDTWLSFSIKTNGQGEIHGLGLGIKGIDEALTSLKIDGSQTWGNRDYEFAVDISGKWIDWQINIGKHFTGDLDFISFINDDDDGNPSAVTSFRDVKIYEKPAPSAVNVIEGDALYPILKGTTANDHLIGTANDTVYRIARGGGADRITDPGGTGDAILFEEGIAPDDLWIDFDPSGDLNILIGDADAVGETAASITDRISVTQPVTGQYASVETLIFKDSGLIDVAQLVSAIASFEPSDGGAIRLADTNVRKEVYGIFASSA